jgi:hypothetical protein
MNLQDFFKAFTCTVRPRDYVDTIDNPVQMGIEGKVTFQRFDKYGKLVSEQIKKNTVSDWVARNREAEIRALARQGTSVLRDWFRSIVLYNRPLDILPNSNNINIYPLDAAGTYIKTLDKHPLVTGYCLDLTNALGTGLKCGAYDITVSNAGRKLDRTRRSFSFPAGKATGIIRSIFLTCSADPIANSGVYQEYHSTALPTAVNSLDGYSCRVVGKNSVGNYIVGIGTSNTSVYEINPTTGQVAGFQNMSQNVDKSLIAYIDGTVYVVSNWSPTNGTITIKKAPWSTGVCDAGVTIQLQKPGGVGYNFGAIVTDGTYLYAIMYKNTAFFIAKINPATLEVIENFDYLTNLVGFNAAQFYIDPADNTLGMNAVGGTSIIRYKITPSAANKYENLYANAQQLGYYAGDEMAYGIYKVNNHYYNANFQKEVIPNNFGARVNLDADENKPDNESVTVHYEFTIL